MSIKLNAILVLFSMFLVSSQIPFLAQSDSKKNEKKIEKIKQKINKLGTGENVIIKVKLYTDTTYQRYLSQVGADNFVVVDKTGNQITINFADVDSIGGKNLSTGVKIAIGVGIGFGAMLLIFYLIYLNNNV